MVVCYLWEIWCARNMAVFQFSAPTLACCLANITRNFSMLLKSMEKADESDDSSNGNVQYNMEKQPAVFCMEARDNGSCMVKIVVDGAWRQETFQGVVAWCVEEDNPVCH